MKLEVLLFHVIRTNLDLFPFNVSPLLLFLNYICMDQIAHKLVFVIFQCLMYLYHYPDIWYDYATWHAKSGSVDSAVKVFQRALKALPGIYYISLLSLSHMFIAWCYHVCTLILFICLLSVRWLICFILDGTNGYIITFFVNFFYPFYKWQMQDTHIFCYFRNIWHDRWT